MNEMMKKEGGGVCACMHHSVFPFLVFIFGLAFLLKAFGVLTDRTVEIAWPIIVAVAGLTRMNENKCKCC